MCERHTPGGVVREGAVAEMIEGGLERRQALAEASAVVVEPARQILRLRGVARVRELRDDLAIAGDGFVVAVGARQCPRPVKLSRGRLFTGQMRHRGQQQLAGGRIVTAHVELRHADLVVALGRELRRQARRQLAELGQRFIPVAVLRERLGSTEAIGGRELGKRRGRRRNGVAGDSGRGRLPADSAQRLVGEWMSREVTRHRQKLISRCRWIAHGRHLGHSEAGQRGVARRRAHLLDELAVSRCRARTIPLHPEAIGHSERAPPRSAARRAPAPDVRIARARRDRRPRRIRSPPAGTAPNPRCARPSPARFAALSSPSRTRRRDRRQTRGRARPELRRASRRLEHARTEGRRRRRGQGPARRHCNRGWPSVSAYGGARPFARRERI